MKVKLMNMKMLGYAILSIVIFASCDTSLEVEGVPDFEVKTEKKSYKVGEEVIFNINGSSRILNFYSGEFGNSYDYREGRIVLPGKVEFSFDLRYAEPTKTSARISVWASTDFNGNRSSFEDIKAATWTDITSRYSINYISGQYSHSGIVDVTDLGEEGKPIYFAFKYVFDPSIGNKNGSIVFVKNILVNSLTEEGNYILSSTTANDFSSYSTGNVNKNPIRSDNRSTELIMWPNRALDVINGVTYTNATYTEEYWVTVPYKVSEIKDVGPDKPVTLKGYSDSRVDSHVHVFSKPGLYKVRFVGINHSIEGVKETIRELDITVTE